MDKYGWPRIWFSRDYPLFTAARFFVQAEPVLKFEPHAAILVIGPIGFALAWRRKVKPAAPEGAQREEK